MIQLIPTVTGAEEARLAEHPEAHQELLLCLQHCSCLLQAKSGIHAAQYQDLEGVPKTAAFNFTRVARDLCCTQRAARGAVTEELLRNSPKQTCKVPYKHMYILVPIVN